MSKYNLLCFYFLTKTIIKQKTYASVPEIRWKHWLLQIMLMLKNQDRSVLDALYLWKENVDKEFEGIEPCQACYSVK